MKYTAVKYHSYHSLSDNEKNQFLISFSAKTTQHISHSAFANMDVKHLNANHDVWCKSIFHVAMKSLIDSSTTHAWQSRMCETFFSRWKYFAYIRWGMKLHHLKASDGTAILRLSKRNIA